MRYACGMNAIQICLYIDQYWYAAVVLAAMSLFCLSVFHLFKLFAWYRHWICWITAINIGALILMFATRSLWWLALPLALELIAPAFYAREIAQLGREHNIPREILQK